MEELSLSQSSCSNALRFRFGDLDATSKHIALHTGIKTKTCCLPTIFKDLKQQQAIIWKEDPHDKCG